MIEAFLLQVEENLDCRVTVMSMLMMAWIGSCVTWQTPLLNVAHKWGQHSFFLMRVSMIYHREVSTIMLWLLRDVLTGELDYCKVVMGM